MKDRDDKEQETLRDLASRFSKKDWERLDEEKKLLEEHHERPSKEETLPLISIEDFSKESPPGGKFH